MLKWKMNIRKPQGLWRPTLTIKIWAEDPKKIKKLNIDEYLDLRELPWAQNLIFSKCKFYRRKFCKNCMEEFPLKFYRNSDIRELSESCIYYYLNLHKDKLEYYIEFRPGPNPDYSDYINWFRDNILIPAENELIKRIHDAEQSQEINISLTSSENRGGGKC